MATGDPALTQDQGPAALDWQDRPEKTVQFMGTANAQPTTAAPTTPAVTTPSGDGNDGGPDRPRTPGQPRTRLGSMHGGYNGFSAQAHPFAAPKDAGARFDANVARAMGGASGQSYQVPQLQPPRPASMVETNVQPGFQPPQPQQPAAQQQGQQQVRMINGFKYLYNPATNQLQGPVQ